MSGWPRRSCWPDEFARSLDVFPFEFSAIIADHIVVSGEGPFDGIRVEAADLRQACEVQARGHLLHLRQAFMETRGRADALAVLIVHSAPAWAALLQNVARLDGHASARSQRRGPPRRTPRSPSPTASRRS